MTPARPPREQGVARASRPRRLRSALRRAWARSRWRWVAATCIAYVALAIWIALPSGARLRDRALWEQPSTQQQFQAWAALLQRFGLEVEAEPLRERVWTLTQGYLELRHQWVWPAQKLALQLGIDQSFRMFSNPQTAPSLLVLELDRGAGFEPIYVARSTQHRWNARQLEHHRIRKLIGRVARGSYEAQWRDLTRWLARRASCDFPEGKRLRARLYRSRTEIVHERNGAPLAELLAPIPESYARTHSAGRFTRTQVLRLDGRHCHR